MEKAKVKTTKKEDKNCQKHNKPFVFRFSDIMYCVDCLNEIFKEIYILDENFKKILA